MWKTTAGRLSFEPRDGTEVEAFGAIEKTRHFNGVYHVLHGAISPIDGIGPGRLRITELLRRADEAAAEGLPFEEVIDALAEAAVAVANIVAPGSARRDAGAVPEVVYSALELARLGLSAESCQKVLDETADELASLHAALRNAMRQAPDVLFIGEIRADGQFNVVWKTKGPIRAQPWSPFITGNEKKPDALKEIIEGVLLGLGTARYLDTILTAFPGLPASISFFVPQREGLLTAAALLLVTAVARNGRGAVTEPAVAAAPGAHHRARRIHGDADRRSGRRGALRRGPRQRPRGRHDRRCSAP